jgi:hypothetical protein
MKENAMPDSRDNLPTPNAAALPTSFPLPLPVSLQRADIPVTDEISLWAVIRQSSCDLSFDSYDKHIRKIFGGSPKEINQIRSLIALPFGRVEYYALLKAATEDFLITNSGVADTIDWEDLAKDASRQFGQAISGPQLAESWRTYTGPDGKIPYLDRLLGRFDDRGVTRDQQLYAFVRQDKINRPCLMELIWSYWLEEAMLVQVMNAISLRFQNRRGPAERSLAYLEIDPLRPISHLLWGYVQDEQHRLTIPRRAAEYDHLYGLRLRGRAVGGYESADSRSHFLEGFNRLLHLTARFYKQDDDTTVRADGFPVLNALKEVHMALSEGGSNQYGDLPWVARSEMLMQQWILARPEMREFFATRPSIIYPEPWMDRVEAAKSLLGIEGPNVLHMYHLATMGERLLLSARYHPWSTIVDAAEAANWARDFRSDVQGYIHAYRAATGVDLSAEAVTDGIDATIPSLLLRRRQELARRR